MRTKILNYTLLIFVYITTVLGAQNQIKSTRITKKDLPKNLSYKGQIKDAYRWADKAETHITLITETGEFPSKNQQYENFRDSELFAYDFLIQKKTVKQSWKMHDFVKDCPVDIKAEFLKNTFRITDLNSDGVGEVWLMYKVACYGDVSPSEMKIMMYQGQKKYAMRGRSRIKLSETEVEGGEYHFDNFFLNGSEKFRNYAKQLWKNNLNERWE